MLLIDDVVATGHTLNNIIKKIENLNGIVSMIMIGLGSCNFFRQRKLSYYYWEKVI